MRPLRRQHVPGAPKIFAAAEENTLPPATPQFAYALPSATSAKLVETPFNAETTKKSSKNNAI